MMLNRLSLLLFGLLLVATSVTGQGDKVRPMAVAGTWYPGDEIQLTRYVDDLLQAASQTDDEQQQGAIRAIISPHAGYRYSGSVAADGYRLLRGQAYKRVLLLGPTHHGWFHGLSIADVTHYETPLGSIPLDLTAIQQLRSSSLVSADPSAHRKEHSLEMQLPFLQRTLQPGWQLVPVLVGQLEAEDYQAVAKLLQPLVNDDTLIVVSSDFTHFGLNYGYRPFPADKDTAARLESLDRGSLEFILEKDPQGFLDYKIRTGTTICGFRPIALLLHLLPADVKGRLISYTTSGALMRDYRNSVSYMSIVFRESNSADTEKRFNPIGLSEKNLQLLHKLASAAVEVVTKPQDEVAWQRLQKIQESVPRELKIDAGAFVTLWKDGRLRGCIGHNKDDYPLYQAMVASGINAARNDVRFLPLRPEELAGLEVEISVLTPPEQVDSYRDFIFGEEGIILEKDGHAALFLPEAAEKYSWNQEQMLKRLALKAGLSDDAWEEGASFKTFRTQTYSAPFPIWDH